MNRVRAAAVCGLFIVALVACSSSSSSTTPTPSPTPTPTAAASAGALPSISLPNNAKELEALLPDTLGGHTLTKFSMKGSDFVDQAGSANAELATWLNSLGKSLDDVSAAYAFDVSGGSTGVFAFRVNGVDHTTLLSTLQQAMKSELPTWTTATVGGKSVQTGSDSTSTQYIYGTADLIFVVFTDDPAVAAEALKALP
jgi:hypothetical protein